LPHGGDTPEQPQDGRVAVQVRKVRAHIAGVVAHVLASEGARVTSGTELLVLESMKMEIPVEAPCDGVIAKVHVAPGQELQENEVLFDLTVP
jgi:biotin carboxyl carrier protein